MTETPPPIGRPSFRVLSGWGASVMSDGYTPRGVTCSKLGSNDLDWGFAAS